MHIAIVPAHNEARTIRSVVTELLGYVDEVVVVDDASTDATAAEASEAGACVLRHIINRGQGASLETGHCYARRRGASYVLHFDADGQFNVADIMPAFEYMQQSQADMLLGSRYMSENTSMPASKKYVILPIARAINRYVYRVHLTDAHNGFRILSKKALDSIYISQNRMAHATEIPARAVKHGLHIVEFPVTVTYHEYGQGIGGGVTVLKDLLFDAFVK